MERNQLAIQLAELRAEFKVSMKFITSSLDNIKNNELVHIQTRKLDTDVFNAKMDVLEKQIMSVVTKISSLEPQNKLVYSVIEKVIILVVGAVLVLVLKNTGI